VDAGALGCGQVFDAPPAHLEQEEGNDQYPQSKAMAMSMSHSGMMCCVNSFAAKLALTAGRDLK